ncbi:hypothetical protein N431DRAFT_338140, partial [Stipitochalara longipes BDJ]
FPQLPFELRLKIYNLLITPRYLHYNRILALRSNLTLDPVIPPLLHVSCESRTFALSQYTIYLVGTRHLYLHPTLDVVLWIRYPGSGSSSRTFRADAQHLLQETSTPNPPLGIPNLAISFKFWSRIVTKEIYSELYESIRSGVERLWIVSDVYRAMEAEKVRGARIMLKRGKKRIMPVGKSEGLWRRWDGISGFDSADREGGERLPDAEFKRVELVLKK